jgi:MinD superfamily P-loop ATPase
MLDTAYTIDEKSCIECGQCRRYCPVAGAIIINNDYQHAVVADLCSGCGLCEAFCPVPGALVRHTRPQALAAERLKSLRRVIWRGRWRYHQHPLMGWVTLKARQQLQSFKRAERLAPA